MKRLFSALLAMSLLLIAACDFALPNREPAIRTLSYEPVDKNAAMLYPTYSKDNKVGFINQKGEEIVAPRFDSTVYIKDINSKVHGVLAKSEREHWHFSLDGKETKLNIEADSIEALPDGQTLIVRTINPTPYEGMDGIVEGTTPEMIKYYDENYDKTRDGIFDLIGNKYVIEPKDGYMIYSSGNDKVSINVYNRIDWRHNKAKLISSDEYDLKSREFIEKSEEAKKFAGYHPVPQWYYKYDDYHNTIYYDKNFNKLDIDIFQLIDFKMGNYGIVRVPGEKEYALIDKNGNFNDIRASDIRQVGNCFVVWNEYWNVENGFSADNLLDTSANVIWSTENGERIIPLEAYKLPGEIAGYTHYRYDRNGTDWAISVVLDKDGEVIKVFDGDGNELLAGEEPSVWRQGYGEESILLGKDNKWIWVDFSKFVDPKTERQQIHIDMATNDFVHITRYTVKHPFLEYAEDFFLDYDGNKIKKTPLLPFTQAARNSWMNQWTSTGYIWIEYDDKRGYIDTKGEWFFVMQETAP